MTNIDKTVTSVIRDRLLRELKARSDILEQQEVIENVLRETTERITEQVESITIELAKQQKLIDSVNALNEETHEYTHHQNETATLAINLEEVFFRSDIGLLAKHIALADDETISAALVSDQELFSRVNAILTRIHDLRGKGTVNEPE